MLPPTHIPAHHLARRGSRLLPRLLGSLEETVIFESLHESAERGELILIAGGYLRWHMRRDGVITIYEILSTRPGAGWEMLLMLIDKRAPIQAKCPTDLPANHWYRRRGFTLARTETTPSGRDLNVWILPPC